MSIYGIIVGIPKNYGHSQAPARMQAGAAPLLALQGHVNSKQCHKKGLWWKFRLESYSR